jgi:hypothetical protein
VCAGTVAPSTGRGAAERNGERARLMEGAPGGASRAHRPATGRCSDCVRRKITGVRTPSKCGVAVCVLPLRSLGPPGPTAAFSRPAPWRRGTKGPSMRHPGTRPVKKSLSTRTLAELGPRRKPSVGRPQGAREGPDLPAPGGSSRLDRPPPPRPVKVFGTFVVGRATSRRGRAGPPPARRADGSPTSAGARASRCRGRLACRRPCPDPGRRGAPGPRPGEGSR